MIRYTIDRFEDIYAVCEDENGDFISILKEQLPDLVKAGDLIIYDNERYIIDSEATKKRREKMIALQNEVFNQNSNS